jgi:hypothetical protein
MPPPIPAAPAPQVTHAMAVASQVNNNIRTPSNAGIVPFSMANFNARDLPCFHEGSMVLLADGSKIPVCDLRRGHVLSNGGIVECLVRTLCRNSTADLVYVFNDDYSDGLWITAWHPVHKNGCWAYPISISSITATIKCEAVYSVLLSNNETYENFSSLRNRKIGRCDRIILNGVPCLTLAHGIKKDSVAHHEYFGSEKVVDDLKAQKDWKTGVVTFNEGCLIRDPVSKLVQSMSSEIRNSDIEMLASPCLC